MKKTAGNVLKGDDVKIEGQFHLDVGPVRPSTGGQNAANQALALPKVRIVEKHPEFAVIEVTCSCGIKTNLRCEYSGSKTPRETKTRDGQNNISDQMADKQMLNGEK